MSKPEFARVELNEDSSWTHDTLSSLAGGASEPPGKRAASDVHEILERVTELTLADWLELADVLAGHF